LNPEIIAHRVNDIETLERAQKAGLSTIESDVSSDLIGGFSVEHGGWQGKFGKGSRLEILTYFNGNVLIDLKHANVLAWRFVERLSRELNYLGISPGVTGRDWGVVSKLARMNDLEAYYTLRDEEDVPRYFDSSSYLEPATGLSIHYKIITPEILEQLSTRIVPKCEPQLQIIAWAPSEIATAKQLHAEGVDRITTDNFEKMRDAFAA